MNRQYDTILAADEETRAGLFMATAQRIGTTPQNVEKDFRVCWTLNMLFNGMDRRPACCSRVAPRCPRASA